MTASIVGIGTWLPEAVRTNDAWPERFGQREHGERTFNDIPPPDDPVAAAIVARDLEAEARDPFLGCLRRHVADERTTADEAEAHAARAALADADLAPSKVDVVLSMAAVPDSVQIPTGPPVAHRIGASAARAMSVDAACASSLMQIEVARAYIESGMARVVLIVQSHLVLRTMPLLHPAAPGLGDGATALVIAASSRGLALRSTFTRTHGEFNPAVSWVRGSDDASDTPWWVPGGAYRMGSRRPELTKILMRDTVAYGAKTLAEAAQHAGVPLARVTTLASVQPRAFLPPAIAEYAGMRREAAVVTYEHLGHLGSCGPIFNLEKARQLGRFERGAFVALYAQGTGFTRSAAILEVV